MNTWDIEWAFIRYGQHPILGPAVKFLRQFRDLIDDNSDGWCYWRAPVKAADKLMTLIENPETASPELIRKAITPIKSFCTRHKLTMPMFIEETRSGRKIQQN